MEPVWIHGMGAATGYGLGTSALEAGLRSGRPALDGLDASVPVQLSVDAPIERPVAAEAWVDAIAPGFWPVLRPKLRTARRSLWLAALCGVEAMVQAGLRPGDADGELGLVVAGSNLFAGALAEAERARMSGRYPSARHGFEMFDTHAIGALSVCLGCRGAGLSVGGASASGLTALITAADLIRADRFTKVLVVALPADLGPADWEALSLLGALADSTTQANLSTQVEPSTQAYDGRNAAPLCRPFDKAASGFVPAELAGAVVLSRERGIAAFVGEAVGLDGTDKPKPSAAGERAVIEGALRRAGIAADVIDLVSAHATSTPQGDAAEAAALRAVFGQDSGPRINAPKGLLGHGLNAAGLVETIACVLQMQSGFQHPNIGLTDPVDSLRFVGGDVVNAPLHRVLKTSFGFGGFNAAAVLQSGSPSG